MTQLCSDLKLPAFKDSEIEFLQEFVNVMRPIAFGLDKLQGDKEAFLPFLMPSLLRIEQSISDMVPHQLKHAQPLARAQSS